ncbi:PEPxxWA-CTERM sorting domain-containing protein [Sphingomonas sp. BIUV-7]|uniref:PEPxxWA-CTERM sorting domain-containing protein n=1 Tax=Sphingomonas natans TaxID=3063330 RepID=A0ABT8YCI9_9SPHN|nr:PEPxxWA-CTERM sorting domain-containing protein [Sphingomonas sp. BIUV-7]MDO6416047.1 PEPxxWA-CTERM sorting domain-containing protein [Sphingomonas sp. BIUV-7]
MTSRIQGLAIAATAAAIAIAAPAAATSFVFNTTGNNTTVSSKVFSSTVAGTTLNVRVSAWQAVDKAGNTDLDDIQSASLGLWDGGLGVTGYLNGSSGSSESTAGNHHQIDNIGNVDFIMLQFDKAVSLTSIYRNVYDLEGVKGADDSDAAYWADTGKAIGTDWTAVYPLSGLDVSEKLWTEIAGNSSDGSAVLTGTVPTASVWLVGASFLATRNDGFKISSLTVSYTPPAVPETATWAMMVMGFGAVGAGLRRRPRVAVTLA